jgi:hypothetical protein
LQNRSGNFAKLIAIRRASSRVSNLAARFNRNGRRKSRVAIKRRADKGPVALARSPSARGGAESKRRCAGLAIGASPRPRCRTPKPPRCRGRPTARFQNNAMSRQLSVLGVKVSGQIVTTLPGTQSLEVALPPAAHNVAGDLLPDLCWHRSLVD